MDSIIAIGVGLVLRVIVDVATENDDRIGGVLVGLWEGVVLNHFMRQMPRSFDPYLGFGFRIFVDFLFTQSLSRLALVALWALVGMLLADIAPNFWRDSGLRHIYRQVRRDVRHVQRSVPHIKIKNDLPSVRLFTKSRSSSSSSIRSDRAVPSRSPAPPPAPLPGPSRRPGRSPPGTLPDTSGWSETNTDVSNIRTRVINPGPSPALIPSREHAAYERIAPIHVATSQTQTTAIRDTTITISQTRNESVLLETTVGPTAPSAAVDSAPLGPGDDPSRHTLPAIPDDWVDIDHPTPAKPNEPVPPFKPDSDSTPESRPMLPAPTQSRPASILVPPPAIDVLPDIPDIDRASIQQEAASLDRAIEEPLVRAPSTSSQPPDQVPLPESRATSEIGGMYDQPQPRSMLRDNLRSRLDKATSEIGIPPSKPLEPIAETSSAESSRSWTSWARSKFGQPVEVSVPEPPPKVPQGEPVGQGKSDADNAAQKSEHQTFTPAQVDPPPSILTHPGVTTPLLFTAEPEPAPPHEQPQASKPDPAPASAGVDKSPAAPQGGADVRDTAGLRSTSLLDLPSPTRSPPPPFTSFAGVPEDLAAGEASLEKDPVTQDEVETELTPEQKTAEGKRRAFLLAQVQELEGARVSLQNKLDKEDDPTASPANALESDLEDGDKTLSSIQARLAKKKFSDPPLKPPIKEVSLANKSVAEVQYAIKSAILDALLSRNDAGPMTVQGTINRQKQLKAGKPRDAREAIMAFAKLYQFTARSETATPGIINITF